MDYAISYHQLLQHSEITESVLIMAQDRSVTHRVEQVVKYSVDHLLSFTTQYRSC